LGLLVFRLWSIRLVYIIFITLVNQFVESVQP
jgi:hypothetical protein